MGSKLEFTEARLSTLLDGLIALADTPAVVSRSQNLVLYGAAVPLDPPEDDPEAEPQFRQLILANERRGSLFDVVSGFVSSDDGRLWAAVATEDVRWLIVNHEKKAQLGAGHPYVSPDGTAFAYTQTVREGDSGYPKIRVVLGDQPGPAFQTVEPAGFSARGAFAYMAYDDGQFGVIVGGEPMGPYGEVAELQWSPDGGRLAFIVGEPAKFERSVVLDTRRGPSYLDVRSLRFSPDSLRLSYVATEKDGDRMVIDGAPGRLYTRCMPVTYSGDSRKVIGRVGIDQGWSVTVDDQPGALYDEVGPPIASHDGATLAYAARRGDRSFVVLGSSESESCDHVYRLAVGEKAGMAFALLKGKNCVLFHNGREVSRGARRPNHLAINPEGTSIAYSESSEGRVRILVDGDPGPGFSAIERLMFAPDGKTPVYTAREGDEVFIVIGHKKHGPMNPLCDPAFDESGRNLAVVVRIGREIWRKILPVS